MFVPRIFIVAGIALIAIALGASGHGLFWLIPFVWIVGGARRRAWYACGPGAYGRYGHQGHYRDRYVDHGTPEPAEPTAPTPPSAEPDPSRDRHEAFPSGH